MDQDFHYYGTYFAAKEGGFNQKEATLIAKAANFIDFLNEDYPSSWVLVGGNKNYTINSRYTYQGGIFQQLLSPQDGVWCAYHFIPGNYDDPPNTPSPETVHGRLVVQYIAKFEKRDTNQGKAELSKYPPAISKQYLDDLKYGKLLNRPQSALSRQLIMDTIKCVQNDSRLESILSYAIGGEEILQKNREDILERFRLILLGVRAHVIADTWAHQDFCGISNVLNTYWDVNYDPASWDPSKWGYGRQSIDYDDGTTSGWKNKVLSSSYHFTNPNFDAIPNGTSYLGHGWMGHLPDFSFVKFRYKPCWADPRNGAIERDNISQYQYAWIELISLFNQSKGNGQLILKFNQGSLLHAQAAIARHCHLDGDVTGRKSSANAWQTAFSDTPSSCINVDLEPDPIAVLDGMSKGSNNVRIDSDLYLFQIAADYHFHFVKNYLERHGIYRFTGSWSQQMSALSPSVSNLF